MVVLSIIKVKLILATMQLDGVKQGQEEYWIKLC